MAELLPNKKSRPQEKRVTPNLPEEFYSLGDGRVHEGWPAPLFFFSDRHNHFRFQLALAENFSLLLSLKPRP